MALRTKIKAQNRKYQLSLGGLLNVGGSLPPDFYVVSARYGGAEALYDGLNVDGDPPGPLEISIASGAATVSGVVRNAADEPVGDSLVVLIPRIPNKRGALTIFQTAPTDTKGVFSISSVPPGEYGVLALDRLGDLLGQYYQDPEFSQRL